MTNQLIRRFQLTGQTSSNKLENNRRSLHKVLLAQMRDEGFVPILDLDPVWNWRWIKDELYDFVYTLQGVYIGRDKAWQTEGISNGKAIPSIQKTK